MGFIEWTKGLDLGIAEIDAQHRGLVERINSLALARENGSARAQVSAILDGLEAYAAAHFRLEEDYFQRYDYAEAAAHRQEHAAFVARIAEFRRGFTADSAGLSMELLEYLRTWLTRHIAFSDRKYRSLFLSRGLR